MIAAAACAFLAAVSMWAESTISTDSRRIRGDSAKLGSELCPPMTLVDGQVCIPVPKQPGRVDLERVSISDHIFKNPDRPEAISRYRSPVAGASLLRHSFKPPPGALNTSEADKPDTKRPPTQAEKAKALPAVLLTTKAGTTLELRELPKQTGPATLLYLRRGSDRTLATHHLVAREGRDRAYVLVLTGIRPAPMLKQGQSLPAGSSLGEAATAQLTLYVYRVRNNVSVEALVGEHCNSPSRTIPTDPRNALELVGR